MLNEESLQACLPLRDVPSLPTRFGMIIERVRPRPSDVQAFDWASHQGTIIVLRIIVQPVY